MWALSQGRLRLNFSFVLRQQPQVWNHQVSRAQGDLLWSHLMVRLAIWFCIVVVDVAQPIGQKTTVRVVRLPAMVKFMEGIGYLHLPSFSHHFHYKKYLCNLRIWINYLFIYLLSLFILPSNLQHQDCKGSFGLDLLLISLSQLKSIQTSVSASRQYQHLHIPKPTM